VKQRDEEALCIVNLNLPAAERDWKMRAELGEGG